MLKYLSWFAQQIVYFFFFRFYFRLNPVFIKYENRKKFSWKKLISVKPKIQFLKKAYI